MLLLLLIFWENYQTKQFYYRITLKKKVKENNRNEDLVGQEGKKEVEEEMKRSSQTDLQKGLMLAGMMMFGGASALFVATLMQRS